MDAVVERLVEKKSLTKQEFFSLVELHGCLQTMPPSIVDIRASWHTLETAAPQSVATRSMVKVLLNVTCIYFFCQHFVQCFITFSCFHLY